MNEDRAFCKDALRDGFFTAFLKYADKDVVKFGEGQNPIIGRSAMQSAYAGKSGTKNLYWEPVDGEVAQSGELGYTWGNWKLTTPDTTLYGNYFTVWKKQKDGSWKVSLDGGNNSPAPN
jgi:ketosteroid isomerase-like protein